MRRIHRPIDDEEIGESCGYFGHTLLAKAGSIGKITSIRMESDRQFCNTQSAHGSYEGVGQNSRICHTFHSDHMELGR